MHTSTRRDLTTSLVADLRGMIASGAIQQGARIPSERDLAARFRVSRSSVRQAIKALELMGVLRQREGDGTYLSPNASGTLDLPLEFLLTIDGITTEELREARIIFEPELAAHAARRRTMKQVIQLEKSVAAMKKKLARHSFLGVPATSGHFHRLIWEMAGSTICLRMLVSLQNATTGGFMLNSSREDYARTVNSYSGVLEAIRSGDGAAARHRMKEYLIVAKMYLPVIG
jgi:GntR family transcriptional repressor for pyruvate dehydrogenase complex